MNNLALNQHYRLIHDFRKKKEVPQRVVQNIKTNSSAKAN